MEFGLKPLRGANPRQVVLAEEVRACVLQLLISSLDPSSLRDRDFNMLDALVYVLNRRANTVTFWVSRRNVVWNQEYVESMLVDMLRFDKGDDC
jgi:hypothetical protein